MKNFIFLNYGIKIDKIYEKDSKKYFFMNNTKYYIYENIKNEKYIDILFNVTNNMFYNNIKFIGISIRLYPTIPFIRTKH